MHDIWAARADAAEAAVVHRHVRRLWGLPGTALGVVSHPANPPDRIFARWHYWWQAHLVDCAVDAAHRSPSATRRRRVVQLVRSVRLRNPGGWTNDYFDDVAWLGLALHRAGELVGVRRPAAVERITRLLLDGWSAEVGGIPWRVGDDFRNAPANGPAGLLLARTGHPDRALATAEWLHTTLRDPGTGLVLDGWRPGGLERAVFTYNQGTVLGLETELAAGGAPEHAGRVHTLVAAVADHLADADVLRTHGGGDGGLFSGILARYLALVANRLPGDDTAAVLTRTTATRLVLTSARSVWAHRVERDGHPVFPADWERAPYGPERDLSVQLGAWMLLEAATRVCGRTPR